MKIKDFISDGYYINLDYREDRNQFMIKQLEELGLYDIIKRYSAVKAFDKTEYIRDDGEKMLAATKAAALSHKNLVQLAKDNNYDNILILEDDALFYNCDEYKGLEIIEKALDDLNKIPNWEIYFLGANLHDVELNLISPNLIKCKCAVSTQSYILNKNTFDKILNQDVITFMDVFLDKNFTEKYITYPIANVQTSDGASDIGGHQAAGLDFWLNQYRKPLNKLYEIE